MLTLGDVFKGKQNNLTFIRLIAALVVIYGHMPAVKPGLPADWVTRTTGYAFSGGVAVDLFFLISGFLVTASIVTSGARAYIVSRALRIYPALWVNLVLVTFVLGGISTTLPVAEYFTSTEVWAYFKGLALTYQGAFFLPGVFSTNTNQAVNGSIWSVLIEVWLYVILLIGYVFGVARNKAVFNSVFFVVIVSAWSDPSWLPTALSSSTNLHVCLFFYIGSFLYMNKDSVPISPYFMLVALFLAAITLKTDRFGFGYVLLIVSFFCCASFAKQFSWLDKYGDYSYGVYLYGWPAQQVVVWLFPGLAGAQSIILSMVLALGCGILSWHFVEKRALKLKSRFIGRKDRSERADAVRLA